MLLRIPFRQRKAGITLVPSGVSKKVEGSQKEHPAVPILCDTREEVKKSAESSGTLLRE